MEHTTTLPTDSASDAESLFKSTIDKPDTITIIVFGDSANSQQAVQNADLRAADAVAGFPRQVIWMKDTSIWNSVKSRLHNGSVSVGNIQLSSTTAISVSLSNKVMFALSNTRTPDAIAMDYLFVKASVQ